MKQTTLCFLVDADRICLAMKKRGFGTGKWNGVGGKVHDCETIGQAAVREVHEEIETIVQVEHLEPAGVIQFEFIGKPDWAQECHVFIVRTWHGDPAESEEMAPRWYTFDTIPYGEMWVDDPLWLPQVLGGRYIKATLVLNETGDEIISQTIAETP